MTIDVSDLLRGKKAKKEIQVVLDDKSFFDGSEEIKILIPLKIDGNLSFIGGILNLDGRITGELELTCSRCVEDFNYKLDLEIHEKFSNMLEEKDNDISLDDDILLLENDNVNLSEIVINNIILVLPIKRLCKEDCKGLCQRCGTNLNLSTCSCEKDDVDPRLSKLKDLFTAD